MELQEHEEDIDEKNTGTSQGCKVVTHLKKYNCPSTDYSKMKQ